MEEDFYKKWNKTLWIVFLMATISFIFVCVICYILGGYNKDLTTQNELLRTENTAQFNKILSLNDLFTPNLEIYKPIKCVQDNTAILELFNKCTFLDTENYQYVQFPIGVNVTALLNPKCPHKSSTNTIYETTYIIEQVLCEECPSLIRCPSGKKPECTGTDICGCSIDCTCFFPVKIINISREIPDEIRIEIPEIKIV